MSETYHLDALAFGPHPDDVELCCGGLLLNLADQGYQTGVVDLTRGELGSNGTPELRAEEAAAAGKVLGLSVRENLGLPDGWIHPWSGYEEPPAEKAAHSHLARVVEVLRRLRPELVLIPWHETRHPDHRATSELLTKALFFAGVRKFETDPPSERFVPRQVLYYQMRYRFHPSFIVDTSAVSERKMEAVHCYSSQFQRTNDTAATLINSNLALQALESRDRYYGAMLGVTHGEPYLCRNTLGMTDPLSFFRDNPFTQPHFFEVAP
ncbi:MAG: bacillithiol biosynthesis deacetylase BshB1 [Deltaproteobacteria bacterium]|nr:MAG: bacillithiol biosynthesis deacetylase BshB1 [Deltaproteobacteria bacterium]